MLHTPSTSVSQTIAIVEDDPDQRGNYCQAITEKGYRVVAFANRPAALEGIDTEPALAVLDIILDNEIDGGFALCRELLARYPNMPIIFLTERVDEIDKISGLRLGAWDYLPKPISLSYLAERVASLLRLKAMREQPQQAVKGKAIGALILNTDAMIARWHDAPLPLTVTEFTILEFLTRSPGHAVTYDALMAATRQQYVTHNTINTHLRNIRRKFREVDEQFDAIKNEYGFGYRWVAGANSGTDTGAKRA